MTDKEKIQLLEADIIKLRQALTIRHNQVKALKRDNAELRTLLLAQKEQKADKHWDNAYNSVKERKGAEPTANEVGQEMLKKAQETINEQE